MKLLCQSKNFSSCFVPYVLTVLTLVLTPKPDAAWGQDVPGTTQNTADATPGVLTLADVLAQAEANHPKLRGSDAERRAATAKRVSKQGAFDVVPYAGSDYLRYNSTSTRGKPLNTTMSDVGVELPFRNGIKVVAGTRLNLGSPKSPDSSTGNTGEWNVSIKAPLRRGFGINEKSAAEQQAFIGEPIAAQNFAFTRLDVLRQASFAYWDWVAAGQKGTVARDLLTLGETRAAQIRRLSKAGFLPEIDSVEAAGEVLRRRGALIKAERDQQKAGFKLSLYLWGGGDGSDNALPAPGLAPPAFPPIAQLAPDAVQSGRERAIVQNPQIQIARLQQDSLRIDERLAENDRQPTLDLVLNPGLDTGARSIGETMKAGLLFSVPLGRREATGRRDEARLKREKFRQEERLLIGQIQTEVDDAANAVELARLRYTVAEEEVTLAERLESAERRKFELGDGTLFLVNQRERATAEARARLIDVQTEYQQSFAAFRAATLQL